VNFTDNLTIVLWKTQLLFHNLWKMYFPSVVYQLFTVLSRSLAPKSRKDCSEQSTSSWTLNVATFQLNSTPCLTQSKHKMQFTSSLSKIRLQWSLSLYVKVVKVLIRALSVLLTLHVNGTNNYVTSDPLKRDQGCNPPGTYCLQQR